MSSESVLDGSDPLVGQRLGGRYRVIRRLSAGAVGVVYEALQEDLGRRVALKVLACDVSPAALARFRLEAEATAGLGSPHIVQVSDFQSQPPEPPFLVMELLSGRSLRDLSSSEGRLPWKRAARIGLQILAALGAAHRAKVVHRDIKPANIFVVSSDAVADFVKVLDFGLAKLLEPAPGLAITHAGTVLGTLAYMSPEQARGEPADERSDLYSVAVCLYELVSRRRPIEGELPYLRAAIGSAERTPIASHVPDIDRGFADVVMHALEVEPARRTQTSGEMADALARVLGQGASFAPETQRDAALPMTSTTVSAMTIASPSGTARLPKVSSEMSSPTTLSSPAIASSATFSSSPAIATSPTVASAEHALPAPAAAASWGAFAVASPPVRPHASFGPTQSPRARGPSRAHAPAPARSDRWWLGLVGAGGVVAFLALLVVAMVALARSFDASQREFMATVKPTPCPAPARCVGSVETGGARFASCLPVAAATYKEGDMMFVRRDGNTVPMLLTARGDGKALEGRDYNGAREKVDAELVEGRYCAP